MNSISSRKDIVEMYLSLQPASETNFFDAESEFIAVAKNYVEDQGYDHAFQAFLSMGVSEKVLAASGISRRSTSTPEAAFIQVARPYFKSGGITYQELVDRGVPIDVLNAAGIKPENEPN